MFHTNIVEKIKIHIFLFNNAFFENHIINICELMWVNTVEGGGEATDENMARAHCMLDT